jgi:hypothetical protein
MKVFSLHNLSNTFQSLVSEDDRIWATEAFKFDGLPKADSWVEPEFRVYNLVLKRGDFLRVASGTLGIREPAMQKLQSILERAGELLPISVSGERVWCLNVTECVNCLDHPKVEWLYGQESKRPFRISKFAFRRDMMPESSIFKIPETVRGTVLTHTGLLEEDDDFFLQVTRHKMTGIRFELLYDDEKN